jgi:hypothetical protein
MNARIKDRNRSNPNDIYGRCDSSLTVGDQVDHVSGGEPLDARARHAEHFGVHGRHNLHARPEAHNHALIEELLYTEGRGREEAQGERGTSERVSA